MVKYFIENKQGEWLMEPDEPRSLPGTPWTRDPDKAWQFEQELSGDDSTRPFNKVSGKYVATCCITATKIKLGMEEEGLFAPGQLKITEHEFIKAWDNEHLLDYNHDIWHDTGERQFRRMSSAAIARDTGIKI